MTYRVLRLTCTTCNEERRVRCRLTDAGDVPEPCPGCGRSDYRDGPPSPLPLLYEIPTDDGGVVLVNPDELAAFWAMFNGEQSDYVRNRFLTWMAETDAATQAAIVGESTSRARMFKQIWEALHDEA